MQTIEEPGQQLEVHPADEVGVLLDESVERTVRQDETRAIAAGLVSTLDEHARGGSEQVRRRRPRTGDPSGSVAERASGAPRRPAEREADRDALALRIGDGSGQQPSGQLVVTLGQADGQLACRATVQLGGPTGAGPATPRQDGRTRPRADPRRRACRGGT